MADSLDFKEIDSRVTDAQKMVGDIHLFPAKHGVDVGIISKDKNVKDYTTAVDRKVEEVLKSELLNIIPGSGFLGEESGEEDTESRFTWIVDPTDGTAVYSLGGEYFSSSIALVDREGNEGRGAVVFGSVYQANENLRQFVRTPEGVLVREGVTTLDDKKWMISRKPKHTRSKCFAEYLGCSFGTSSHYPDNPGMQEKLEGVFRETKVPELNRIYPMKNAKPASGSSALFCSDIGDGNRHFALLFYQKAWDLAVGALFARDAGCPVVVFDNAGNPTDKDLETEIVNCNMKTLVNVGVFGSEYIQDAVMKRFG